MGLPMAQNLLKKGHPVMVYDVVDSQVQIAANDGATVAKAIPQVAAESNTIVTMLPTG